MLFRSLPILLPLFLAASFQPDARAVILAGGLGTQNTTAPGDDFGFGNVGTVNQASGVYLGNGWVLTAYHVVIDFVFLNANFGGTSYTGNPSTAVRLQNADNSPTDLALFRLTTMPPLPEVTLSLTTPVITSSLIMMGNGRNRDATETHWDVATLPNPDVWTETLGPGDELGYKWAGGNTLRWGTNNQASLLPSEINYGLGDVTTFRTNFSNSGGSEAQAAIGDSGGGVFFKNGGEWELAGIMLAVNGLNGQPNETAVYGNETFSADIATYQAQILNIIPEPTSAMLLVIGAGALLRRRR